MNNFFILLLCSLLFTACISKECQVFGSKYDFELSATLSPAQLSYRVGDTISIESVFSSELFDLKTEQWYTLESISFYPELGIREISTPTARQDGLDDFEVLIEPQYNFHEFRYSSGSVGYIGEYNYDVNGYDLKLKLVAREAGFFCVSLYSSVWNLGKDQEFPGKCDNLNIDANVKLNEGEDNNIGLLANSPDEYYNTWTLEKPFDRFHRFGGGCFCGGVRHALHWRRSPECFTWK